MAHINSTPSPTLEEDILSILQANSTGLENTTAFTKFIEESDTEVFASIVHVINEYWFQGYNAGNNDGRSLLPSHMIQLLKEQWHKGYNIGYSEGRSNGNYEGRHNLP